MDLLLWFGFAASTSIGVFTLGVIWVGAKSLTNQLWSDELRSLAQRALAVRGIFPGDLTGGEVAAYSNLVQSLPAKPDADSRRALVGAIAAFTGRDIPELTKELESRSLAQFVRMKRRQLKVVEAPVGLVWVSRAWRVVSVINSIDLWGRGLAWFGPLCAGHVGTLAAKYIGFTSVAGAAGGLLWWGLAPGAKTGQSWLAVIGGWITFASVAGLVFIVFRMGWTLAVWLFGPPSTWTWRGVLGMVALLSFSIGLAVLAASGVLTSFAALIQRAAAAALAVFDSRLLGAILLSLLSGWFVLRALRYAVNPVIRHSSRVFIVAIAVLMLAVGVLSALWALRVDGAITPVLSISGLAAIAATVLAGSVWLCEFANRLLTLRAAGKSIAVRGFHWQFVVAYVLGGVVIDVTPALPSSGGLIMQFISILVQIQLGFLSFAFAVGWAPLFVAGGLWVRRVDRAHRSYLVRPTAQ